MPGNSQTSPPSRWPERGFGNTPCVPPLATTADTLGENARSADEVAIIDSCPAVCTLTALSSCRRAIEAGGTGCALVPASRVRQAIGIVLYPGA